jgi:transposase
MGRNERGDLSDAEWERLRPFLPVSNGRCGRWRDHRQVIDGILHRVRTGVQWRDLPERRWCFALMRTDRWVPRNFASVAPSHGLRHSFGRCAAVHSTIADRADS